MPRIPGASTEIAAEPTYHNLEYVKASTVFGQELGHNGRLKFSGLCTTDAHDVKAIEGKYLNAEKFMDRIQAGTAHQLGERAA